MEQQIKECESLTEVLDDLDSRGIYGVLRYKAVNQYLSLKARYHDIPISGTFELTPLCNLDCKMCYVHLCNNQLKQSERLLTVNEWKQIIKQAVDAGLMYVSLTGGECLTYQGFRELYLYVESLGVQPDILTNGVLLTEDMIEFFSQNPPGIMQVSLYGSSEEAYEKVTGHRVFQRVIDGIKRAKQAGLNISIAIMPNRFMKDDASSLLDLLYSLNVPYAISASTLPARPETKRELTEFEIDAETLFQIQQQDVEHNQALSDKKPLSVVPRYAPPLSKKLAGLPCGGAHSSFHVNWRGELCPCIAFASAVHYSVLENGFADAWNTVRRIMTAYEPPRECKSCNIRDKCKSCPGEKNMGELIGILNTSVCAKLKSNLDGRVILEKHDPCDT